MTWLGTVSGKKIDLLNPDPDQIDINDIIKVLPRLPRFNGHTDLGWSVGQHSIAVSQLVAPQFKAQAIAHDFTEAYLCDVPTPLKVMLGEAYYSVERRLANAIGAKLGIELVSLPDVVRAADRIMLMSEHEFFRPKALQWETDYSLGVRAPKSIFNIPNDVNHLRLELRKYFDNC